MMMIHQTAGLFTAIVSIFFPSYTLPTRYAKYTLWFTCRNLNTENNTLPKGRLELVFWTKKPAV